MELVRRRRHHVDILLLDVYGDMPYSLYCVSVEQNSLFAADSTYFRNRLYGTYLIVGIHYGHKRGIVGNGVSYLVGCYKTVLMHIEICDRKALLFQLFKGVQHRVVLKRCGDYMGLSLCFAFHCRRYYRLIVCLAAARCEIYFAEIGTDTFGYGTSCLIKRLSRRLPDRMKAGRIAIDLLHIGHHGFKSRIAQSCCCCVVSVYCHFIIPFILVVLNIFRHCGL